MGAPVRTGEWAALVRKPEPGCGPFSGLGEAAAEWAQPHPVEICSHSLNPSEGAVCPPLEVVPVPLPSAFSETPMEFSRRPLGHSCPGGVLSVVPVLGILEHSLPADWLTHWALSL